MKDISIVRKKTSPYPIALTIAGSDSCGGAGIQADLKTFFAMDVYGASVITAITAQNTLGVQSVYPLPDNVMTAQLQAVLSDISFHAIKIGMLANRDSILAVAAALRGFSTPLPPVILDPVLVSSSGKLLLDVDARVTLVEELFPLAALITPNLPEAALLLGISEVTDAEDAARELLKTGPVAVLIKGGHSDKDLITDTLVKSSGAVYRYTHGRMDCPDTHGTGCTLSAAIAAKVARKYSMETAVEESIEWLLEAIGAGWSPGHGPGPVNHSWELWPKS